MQKIPNFQKLMGSASKTLSQSIRTSIAKQGQTFESIAYDNHEMVVSIGVSSIIVGVVVCIATGEITILYIVAGVLVNTAIDLGISLLYTAIMRSVAKQLKAKEAYHGQNYNPEELYA